MIYLTLKITLKNLIYFGDYPLYDYLFIIFKLPEIFGSTNSCWTLVFGSFFIPGV